MTYVNVYKRIIDAINDGDKVVEVVERFSVGVGFVYSLIPHCLIN